MHIIFVSPFERLIGFSKLSNQVNTCKSLQSLSKIFRTLIEIYSPKKARLFPFLFCLGIYHVKINV